MLANPNHFKYFPLIFGCLLAASAQAQITFPVERPILKVGDSWSYERTDLWTNQTMAGVSTLVFKEARGDKLYFNGINRDGRVAEWVRNIDLNSVSTVRGIEQVDQQFKWPMIENAKYTYKTLNTRNQWEWTYEPTCTVEGKEMVKTRAGEFETVKIYCKGFWANTPGNGTNSGTNESIVWYSPLVKQGVKYQNKSWNNQRLDTQTKDELVEYKLN
jgi:hypothetical protein